MNTNPESTMVFGADLCTVFSKAKNNGQQLLTVYNDTLSPAELKAKNGLCLTALLSSLLSSVSDP